MLPPTLPHCHKNRASIAPSAQLAQELATTGDELSQTEPDFDQFPHTNPRAAWGVKKSKAEQIKREILNITGAVDFFALQDDPRYSTNELNWVRKNLLTKQQRNALTATIKKTAMEIQ
jgi:hypothetical protein